MAGDAHGFALFDTPLGACALVWGPNGLLGVYLPEADPHLTRARVHRRFPDAVETEPTPQVAEAISAVGRLLRGETENFAGVTLDLSAVPDFNRRVYDLACTIPPGETLTYGEVAARIGEPGHAQAVGQALGANPFPIIVPCHRVVAAGGKLHGFSAPGGLATKRKLLAIEGSSLKGASLFGG
ncbi:MAG: methylated-DNA--[protein]-cysteine S-methyltransferase [Caulobacteraceae bacterium]